MSTTMITMIITMIIIIYMIITMIIMISTVLIDRRYLYLIVLYYTS